MPSMQTSDVTQDRLQRLATFEPADGARVLSLYLNLDPTANLHAPVNRRSAVNSLLDEAARAVEIAQRQRAAGHQRDADQRDESGREAHADEPAQAAPPDAHLAGEAR